MPAQGQEGGVCASGKSTLSVFMEARGQSHNSSAPTPNCSPGHFLAAQVLKSGGPIWLMSLRKPTIIKTTICLVHSNGKKAARSCRGHFEPPLRTMGEPWLLKCPCIKAGERPVAGDNSTQPHPFQHRRVLRPEPHRLCWPTNQYGNRPYVQPGRHQQGHRAFRCMVRFQISPEPPSRGPGPTLHRCQVNHLQLRHESSS